VPPFDFTKSLDFLGFFPPTEGDQNTDRGHLTKATTLGAQVIVFGVVSTGEVEAPVLACQLHSDRVIATGTKAAVLKRVRAFLSLDDDLKPFYAAAKDDTAFTGIIKGLYGYHQVRFLTPFENACWAILSQRTPLALARKVKRLLTGRFGGCLSVDGTSYHAFPEPEGLLRAPREALDGVVGNARKTARLLAAAKAFLEIDDAFLTGAPSADVKTWLKTMPGIGEWSADFILLRGLGRMERAPATEGRLLEAASRVYGQPVNAARLAQLAEPYGNYKGYWAHYLRVAG
jgi:DNA-3-methyladenine glycosylase II